MFFPAMSLGLDGNETPPRLRVDSYALEINCIWELPDPNAAHVPQLETAALWCSACEADGFVNGINEAATKPLTRCFVV
jgi:hypothetical protein